MAVYGSAVDAYGLGTGGAAGLPAGVIEAAIVVLGTDGATAVYGYG